MTEEQESHYAKPTALIRVREFFKTKEMTTDIERQLDLNGYVPLPEGFSPN